MSSGQHYSLQLEKLKELIKHLEFFNAEMLQIMNNYQNKLLALESEGVPAEVIAKFRKDFFAKSKELIKKNEAIIKDQAIPLVSKHIRILEQLGNPSALRKIMNAGAQGMASPSAAAQLAAELRAPPGAEEAVAQGLQAAWNMGVVGSQEFMDATIRQHGRSPAAVLQDIKIKQALDQSAPNKGI